MSDNKSSEVWNFISAPDLHPMKVTININNKKKTDSAKFIFVSPYTIYGDTMIGQTGALIMDTEGNPIWFRPLDSIYIQNTDFRVQKYKGELVLTMWEGTIAGTQSSVLNLPAGDPEPGAYYIIVNKHYEVIKKLYAKKDYTSDLHEFTITKKNTALFTAIKQVKADLTPYGGPKKGYFDNYSIQEVDIESNKLLFFWNVLDHVNPADSMVPASSAVNSNNIWDCFHVNSIDVHPHDDNLLLISMRNMWALYVIDKTTKKIIWQLGGKKNDFTILPKAGFSWQHHARFRGNSHISLFDDACCASSSSSPQGQSRGLVLNLNFKKMTAAVYKTFYHDPALFVASQGDSEKMSNGNYFIGWGQEPFVSEFLPEGNTVKNLSGLIYDMQFPSKNISYRSFKNNWVGLPRYNPNIAAILLVNKHSTLVFASWNGSTETVAWNVLAGTSRKKLSIVIDSFPRIGFETVMNINSIGPYFQINALNCAGKIIGTSDIYRAKKFYNCL